MRGDTDGRDEQRGEKGPFRAAESLLADQMAWAWVWVETAQQGDAGSHVLRGPRACD